MYPLTTRLFALALVALAPIAVFAQTLTLTPAPSMSIQTIAVPEETFTECYRVTSFEGGYASISLAPGATATVTGARCYRVYPTGGGTARVPITTAPSSVADNEDGSGNRTVKVVVPAVLGSLAGVMFILLGAAWYIRRRRRDDSQNSRPGRWAAQNSWTERKEVQAGMVQTTV